MQAKDIMTSNVVSAPADGKIEEAIRLMLDHHVSAVPVVDKEGALQGLVSEGDLMRRLRSPDDQRRSCKSWAGPTTRPGISSSSKATASKMS